MSRKADANPEAEGWESLSEEASGGSLAPSPELEEALREAEAAVEARHAVRSAERGHAGHPGQEALERELAALKQEKAQLEERWLRLQADFENHRKRTLREKQEALSYGHEIVVKDLLPVVDNLERAIEHASASSGADFEGMLQGVELVRRELLAVLAKHGVSAIEAEGEVFDPNLHEALAQMEDERVPAGRIGRMLQKGYRLRDRLLRPARVMVSKGPGQPPAAGEGSD
jgi:molecular chaperone GrpE